MKNFLGTKKFSGPKKLGYKKIWDQKIFGVQKKCWSKKFWVKTIFGLKNFFRSEKFFESKFFWDPRICLVQKIFGLKSFMGSKEKEKSFGFIKWGPKILGDKRVNKGEGG